MSQITGPLAPSINDGPFSEASILIADKREIVRSMSAGGATADTPFHAGSLKEAICTSFCMMVLTADKRLSLNAPVAKYIPAFGEEGKDKVSLKQLLKHTSGLASTRPYMRAGLPAESVLEKICYEELEYPPAFERKKSELGYFVLESIVQKLAGKPMEEYFIERVAKPLGLVSVSFSKGGLMISSKDCIRFASLLLECYNQESSFVPKEIVEEFIGTKARYKLGWDTAPEPFPRPNIGMLSDTGCSLWICLKDPLIFCAMTKCGDIDSLEKALPEIYTSLLAGPKNTIS